MDRYNKVMEGISRVVFIITSVFISLMVIIISVQVFGRFVLNKTPRWSEETTLLLMLYTGFLGATVVYRERMHIGIRAFLLMFPPKGRTVCFFIIDGLVGVFSAFMAVWGTGFAWMMRNQTMPATKVPVGISYLPIPIAGVLLVLFVFEKIMKDISELKTGSEAPAIDIPGLE